MQWLIGEARAAGVAFVETSRVAGLRETASRVAGVVLEDGSAVGAHWTLISAGAWTPVLLPDLKNVMSASGQPLVYLEPAQPAAYEGARFPVWAADIATTGWYGFPLSEQGILKLANHGPGRAMHPDEPRGLEPEEVEQARQFLKTTMPDVAAAKLVGARRCLYCDTWDGDFWIDHDPRREGLVVACGGSGHAFKFAPVLGEIVADVLERKPNPFAHRFAWREPGRPEAEPARRK